MPSPQSNPVMIVGCGRWLRRDDQAGLIAAERLAADPPSGATVVITEAPGGDIVTSLGNVGLLVILDAASASEAMPSGTWRRLEHHHWPDLLRSRAAGDSHSLGVDVALRLAERLGVLPPEVWIYAIAVEDVGFGEHVSPGVQVAIDAVARAARHDVSQWTAARREAEPCMS